MNPPRRHPSTAHQFVGRFHHSKAERIADGIVHGIGLVAAIPAVIIYNVFSRSIAGYRATLSDASGEVLRHLSRDLERMRRAPQARAGLHAVPAQAAALPRARAE